MKIKLALLLAVFSLSLQGMLRLKTDVELKNDLNVSWLGSAFQCVVDISKDKKGNCIFVYCKTTSVKDSAIEMFNATNIATENFTTNFTDKIKDLNEESHVSLYSGGVKCLQFKFQKKELKENVLSNRAEHLLDSDLAEKDCKFTVYCLSRDNITTMNRCLDQIKKVNKPDVPMILVIDSAITDSTVTEALVNDGRVCASFGERDVQVVVPFSKGKILVFGSAAMLLAYFCYRFGGDFMKLFF